MPETTFVVVGPFKIPTDLSQEKLTPRFVRSLHM